MIALMAYVINTIDTSVNVGNFNVTITGTNLDEIPTSIDTYCFITDENTETNLDVMQGDLIVISENMGYWEFTSLEYGTYIHHWH